jgi:hypothetical protein
MLANNVGSSTIELSVKKRKKGRKTQHQNPEFGHK